MSDRLYHLDQTTDRWSNRAVSPFKDFTTRDGRGDMPVAIIHPGWATAPEAHANLMHELLDAGIVPIGVDTRFGYSNQSINQGYRTGSGLVSLVNQSYRVGTENPYFHATSEHENRYRLRRPTGLAALCVAMGITKASLIGNSDGGRIVTTLAAESDVLEVPKLIVVSSVGTGDSSQAVSRAADYLMDGSFGDRGVFSKLESLAYGVSHPHRFAEEAKVIQETNIWPMLGKVSAQGTDVVRIHALDDQMVGYGRPVDTIRDNKWTGIRLIPTWGGHSIIYDPEIRTTITELVTAPPYVPPIRAEHIVM